MATQSKRKSPRAPVEIKVEYHRLNAFIADYTSDISRGGLFVATQDPLEINSECYFTLSFPNCGEPITLQGVVTRVVEADGDEPAGMGVKFVFEDPAEQSALNEVVDEIMVEHLGSELYERLYQKPPKDAGSALAETGSKKSV
tara:strand:- start:68 stop:496 length:429 start_codon:yes stop_codon:yes gene_type:complete